MTSCAELVWFDPGVTTGAVSISIDKTWLQGEGSNSWDGLGLAVEHAEFMQFGRHARIWDYENNKARFKQYSNFEFSSGSEINPDIVAEINQVSWCLDFLDSHPDAAWGYEDFILRSLNQSREFISPVRMFSMITYGEFSSGKMRAPFVQNASMAKSTATDERLKDAGLYRPGMLHAVDAMRHATTFLRRARADSKLREKAFPTETVNSELLI